VASHLLEKHLDTVQHFLGGLEVPLELGAFEPQGLVLVPQFSQFVPNDGIFVDEAGVEVLQSLDIALQEPEV